MLSDARDILANVASVDPTLVEDARQRLRRFTQRIAGLARTFKRLWIAATVAMVVAGIGFVVQFHFVDESRVWTIAAIITFLALALLGGAIAYAFAIVTDLPRSIDSLADSAQATLAGARDDWAAISQASGIRSAVRTLWAAGKLLRSVRHAQPQLAESTSALTAIALMANPLFWIGNAILAVACVLAPLVFAMTAAIRSMM